MPVLPYLILFLIHLPATRYTELVAASTGTQPNKDNGKATCPQIQEDKNIKTNIIKKEGNKLTAKILYRALEIQLQLQIQMQIIIEKLGVQVEVEVEFLKKLSKKEKYENRKYFSRFG